MLTNDTLAVVIGLVIGALVSVPVAFVIAGPTRRRPEERPASAQRVDAELITDKRIAISKDDYIASIKALGDGMASHDPRTRQLAAFAYDAFLDAVKPS